MTQITSAATKGYGYGVIKIQIKNMTTNIVVLDPSHKVTKKPIEFNCWLSGDKIIRETGVVPSRYRNIELICKNYRDKSLDLMFAYDDAENRSLGALFLGHFNDGVV